MYLCFINTIFKTKSGIKFGQVWKAKEDYKITIHSRQEGCVIPKDTRIVVLNTPEWSAKGFDIIPLTSKGLDRRLVPDLKQMEKDKEGFGVTITIEYFKKKFVLDKDQTIAFDNNDASEFWKRIVKHL